MTKVQPSAVAFVKRQIRSSRTERENKTIFKAFKIKFEVEEEKSYNPEFVKRVLLAKEEIKQGKGVKISTEDLWK